MSLVFFIGRENEKAILKSAVQSPESEFIAVYGRRRVGKTHLIREFFRDSICFELIGKYKVNLREQLENFAFAFGKAKGMDFPPKTPSSWSNAFFQLQRFLESQKTKKGKRNILSKTRGRAGRKTGRLESSDGKRTS